MRIAPVLCLSLLFVCQSATGQDKSAAKKAAQRLAELLAPSAKVEQALPIAHPQRDRASLADPTLEASIAVALGRADFRRAGPAPFQPINLPDPFEHSQVIRLRDIPDEIPTPPLITK